MSLNRLYMRSIDHGSHVPYAQKALISVSSGVHLLSSLFRSLGFWP